MTINEIDHVWIAGRGKKLSLQRASVNTLDFMSFRSKNNSYTTEVVEVLVYGTYRIATILSIARSSSANFAPSVSGGQT